MDTIAVGVAREVAGSGRHFDGDVVILHPWDASSDGRGLAGETGDHDGVPAGRPRSIAELDGRGC